MFPLNETAFWVLAGLAWVTWLACVTEVNEMLKW